MANALEYLHNQFYNIRSSITGGNMSPFICLRDLLHRFKGNSVYIKTFLERNPSSVNEKDLLGNSHLHFVLMNDKFPVDVVKLFLNYGANVNCSNAHGLTPLMIAFQFRRNVKFIRLLLEKGANLDVFFPAYGTLICYALKYFTSEQAIRLLLEAGCRPSACQLHGSVLHCALACRIQIGPMQHILQMLIDRKANVNAVGTWGRSVMCYALGIGVQARSIEVLLAAGGVLSCTKHINPLLCITSFTGTKFNVDVIQLLLKQGARVSPEVLQSALKTGTNETKAIELLLDHLHDVDPKDTKDEMHNTLLHQAVCNILVKKSVVKLLVKRGVGVNRVNKYGNTALHEIARSEDGRPHIVKALLKRGSSVNLENASGKTPLHLAMMQLQDANTLKLLLAAGAKFGVTGHSLLKGVIGKCNYSLEMNLHGCRLKTIRLDCCKLLLKCYFLENADFNFQFMIQGHHRYEELSRFEVDCMREIRKLEAKIVDCTLREFLRGRSPFQVDAANCEFEAESKFFHRLLRMVAENAFPLFLDVISAKVGRSSMKIKLQKLEVYTYLSVEPRNGEKVVLNYDVVYKIAYLLTDEDDLLRFISAFYKPDSCAGKVSKEIIYENNRSSEDPEQGHKRPKLQLENSHQTNI